MKSYRNCSYKLPEKLGEVGKLRPAGGMLMKTVYFILLSFICLTLCHSTNSYNYRYDDLYRLIRAEGEQVHTDTLTNGYRCFQWNEDNQLLGVEENGYISRYTYDSQGERIVKAHGGIQGVFINGAPAASIIKAEQVTTYISPFMTVTGGRFTKHYYAGTKRIASKIGIGTFDNQYRPGSHNILAGGVNCIERYNQIEQNKKEYIRSLGVLPGPPVQYGPDITNETANGGFGFITTGHIEETDRYFYHSDHLGSSSYITDWKGDVSQFMVYLPFGELLVDKHVTGKSEMPYKFNAKEKDEETGLYYYGARYYNGKDQIWMGVDPAWEKYPGVSPYAYCLNNPLRYIDLDGRDPGDLFKTPIAAAKDWGNYYNGASILRDKEFGSSIYVVQKGGRIYYTYTDANEGTYESVRTSKPENGERVVADIHSHAAATPSVGDNRFSNRDKWNYYNAEVDGFVATPDGSLKKYDFRTTEETVISTNMPSDPKDPNRKNKKEPIDVPKMKEKEIEMNGQQQQSNWQIFDWKQYMNN